MAVCYGSKRTLQSRKPTGQLHACLSVLKSPRLQPCLEQPSCLPELPSSNMLLSTIIPISVQNDLKSCYPWLFPESSAPDSGPTERLPGQPRPALVGLKLGTHVPCLPRFSLCLYFCLRVWVGLSGWGSVGGIHKD